VSKRDFAVSCLKRHIIAWHRFSYLRHVTSCLVSLTKKVSHIFVFSHITDK